MTYSQKPNKQQGVIFDWYKDVLDFLFFKPLKTSYIVYLTLNIFRCNISNQKKNPWILDHFTLLDHCPLTMHSILKYATLCMYMKRRQGGQCKHWVDHNIGDLSMSCVIIWIITTFKFFIYSNLIMIFWITATIRLLVIIVRSYYKAVCGSPCLCHGSCSACITMFIHSFIQNEKKIQNLVRKYQNCILRSPVLDMSFWAFKTLMLLYLYICIVFIACEIWTVDK